MATEHTHEPGMADRIKAAGIFVPAGLLVGMGIGFLIGNVPAGMFVGLGVGLAGWGLVALFRR
jgi:hypothetical protein